ncbi:MAG: hypothetical protein HY321_19850 [Armatimonadetes bacterium]|nr:hypothetical protein [Armatimonadota bacterium]
MTRWTKDEIAMEILNLYGSGEPITQASVARRQPALLRAAYRHFGSWRTALTFAGIPCDEARATRAWTREKIIARIRELRDHGADLSWRSVRTRTDPLLAAAAVRAAHFGSWRAAIEAAGLAYDDVCRRRAWDEESVLAGLRALAARGGALSSGAARAASSALHAAAVRRFGSWERALEAAGLGAARIRRGRPRREAPD